MKLETMGGNGRILIQRNLRFKGSQSKAPASVGALLFTVKAVMTLFIVFVVEFSYCPLNWFIQLEGNGATLVIHL